MHTQLQGTTTSLKILLGNAVITPAVHHLSERDHTLRVAVLCLGSSENTTKSRKCGSTATDKNTNNEERKMMPGSREGDISSAMMRFFISLLVTRKWSCAKSHAGV